MRIVVLVKQVPHPEAVEFDPETRSLRREGVPAVLNPFDEHALDHALAIASEADEVVTMTMGPPQAEEALAATIDRGADRAVHLSDRRFAVADTLGTSRTLALAIRREAPDLVLCGLKTVDSETWQVPPQVAAALGWTHLTGAVAVERRDGALLVTRESDAGEEVHEVSLPAVVSIALPPAERRGRRGAGGSVARVTADDLVPDAAEGDDRRFGQRGSPTRVLAVRDVTPERKGLRATDVEEAAAHARELLAALEPAPGSWDKPPHAAEQPGASYSCWTWVELHDGRPTRHSLELLARGRELAGKLGGRNVALVLGDAPELGPHGAELTVSVEGDFGGYVPDTWAAAVRAAVERERPHVLLLPASANGRDLGPRVAGELGLGMTGDCSNVDIVKAGRLLQTKPAYGGNIAGVIMGATTPQLATVRSRMFSPLEPRTGETAEVQQLSFDAPPARTRLVETRPAPAFDVDAADTLVLLGNVPSAPDLGATVAGTGAASAAGLVPRNRQVGLHGRAVAPRLLVALGVEGRFDDTAGFAKAGVVVSIGGGAKFADVVLAGDPLGLAPRFLELV